MTAHSVQTAAQLLALCQSAAMLCREFDSLISLAGGLQSERLACYRVTLENMSRTLDRMEYACQVLLSTTN